MYAKEDTTVELFSGLPFLPESIDVNSNWSFGTSIFQNYFKLDNKKMLLKMKEKYKIIIAIIVTLSETVFISNDAL